jgi:dihydropteroate synthase
MRPMLTELTRAHLWRLPTRQLAFGSRPRLMGILNVTPDSFSDGGRHFRAEQAIAHGLRLIDEGADLIDVGGESTRPYSESVSVEEELRRVMPVVEALGKRLGTSDDRPVLSIDTSKARVAREAMSAGCEAINDVTALTGDRAMLEVARESQAGVCAMHMRGTPQTMQDDPRYEDLIGEIADFLRARRDALVAAGIDCERICLDPGIGFGKTHEHNIILAANCWRFHELGCPLLAGHSNKGFIGHVLRDKARDRTLGTVGASLALAAQGVQILRVHDVRATRDALLLFEACGGLK